MIVLFVDFRGPKAGKGFQLQSIYHELPNQGVETTLKGPHDVVLENARLRMKSSKPKVLRVDGCYHDTGMDWKAKNQSLKDSAHQADHVICQSEYGKFMLQKYLGIPDSKCTIVFNGSDPRYKPPTVEQTHRHEFIALSKWRPHKRLKDALDAFLLADIPESCLRVFGQFGKGMDKSMVSDYSDPRILWLGPMYDRPTLMGYIKQSIAMIHLCQNDCCPNSVVEAICMGTPVICGNTGGTPEIVRPSGGTVLDLQKPYDGEPIDLYHPVPIDVSMVSEAMKKMVENRPNIVCDHVDIRQTAYGYKRVFEKVV